MNDSENQRYCGTHGCPIGDDMCCSKCSVDWAKKYKFDKKQEELSPEEWEKWKDSYWLGREVIDDLLKGKNGDYDKYLNKGIIGNQKWFKDYQFKDYMIQNYFCDNCKIVQFHHLQHCPKCGGNFVRRKMTSKEFHRDYSDYRGGW